MTPQEFLDIIKEKKSATAEAYEKKNDFFLQHYSLEQEFADEYNGRQILELMQNADDSGATNMNVQLDIENKTLRVSNNGSQFTTEGMESIMMGGLSTKPKHKFIGNKGLGFRSILKWSSSITLYTQGCRIIFSEKEASRNFEGIIKEVIQRDEIRRRRNLPASIIPFPILALPEMRLDKNDYSNNKTVLEIHYNPAIQDSIQAQMASLKPELLLFLKNLDTIVIEETYKDSKVIHLTKTEREKLDENSNDAFYLAQSGAITWNIIYRECQLPESQYESEKTESQLYSLGVAWRDDLGDNFFKLFSYFPTKEQLNLPCIVHATFDLSSNRNGLNESKKNDFILIELVQLLGRAAIRIKNSGVDWQPFKILSLIEPNTNTNFTSFIANINKLRAQLSIYPCIDCKYKNLNEVKFYTNKFSHWILNNKFSQAFPEILLPIPDELIGKEKWQDRVYEETGFIQRINSISPDIDLVVNRADLIVMLSENIFPGTESKKCRYELLTDDKNTPISKDKVAFTPQPDGKEKMVIPHFIKLDTINEDLYKELDNLIPVNTGIDSRERAVQTYLRPIVNIQAYDATPIIEKIVKDSQTELLSSSDEDKAPIIKEMVATLFVNYRNIKSKDFQREFTIPLIDQQGNIANAEDLYLGKGFISGKITTEIYEGFFDGSKYVNDNGFWNLAVTDEMEIELFFVWLGVNRFSKIRKLKKDWVLLSEYVAFINKIDPEPMDRYDFSRINIDMEVNQLADFETIKRLSLNKIVLLVLHDEKIRRKLYLDHQDRMSWNYSKWDYELINTKPSFIKFQFEKAALFSSFVLGDFGKELTRIINDDIKFDYDFFLQLGYSNNDINDKLMLLGAARSFDQLQPKRVYKIIRSLKLKNFNGDNTQGFYKLALNILEQKNFVPETIDLEGLEVFAKMGDTERGWRLATEVYYSNDTMLPETITRDKWILNIPKRFGEDKVTKYLGVRLFSSFSLKIISGSVIDHDTQNELDKWLQEIHPFLLAYRFRDKEIQQITKEQAASLLKSYKIHLVSETKYLFNNADERILGPNEFVNPDGGRIFYLCAGKNFNLRSLCTSSEFSDAIAEILCIVSKVWEHRDDFRNVFRNGAEDTTRQFLRNGEESFVIAAKGLLGISPLAMEFWNAILFLHDESNLPHWVSDEKSLGQYLKTTYDYALSPQYKEVDFLKMDSIESFQFLKSITSFFLTSPDKIHKRVTDFPGLVNWHVKQIFNSSKLLETRFVSALWVSLQEADVEEQKKYNRRINNYQNLILEYASNVSSKNMFVFDVNYEEEIIIYLKNTFDLGITNLESGVEVMSFYPELKQKFPDYKELLTVDELSLFFFKGHKDNLEVSLLNSQNDNNVSDTDKSHDDLANIAFFESRLSDGDLPPLPKNNTRAAATYNAKKERQQKKAGVKAEKIVRDYLVRKYGRENVKWISGNTDEENVIRDDGKGYDIEYWLPGSTEAFFLEVKSVSSDSFIISANEVRVALENTEKYHLALVQGQDIHLVKDFFLNQERVKTFNFLRENGSVRSLNFEVFFSLPK